MKRITREWLRKAEADFRGALRLVGAHERLHDLVAFHCQQCAEKYLKAMLEESGRHVPKTHDLDDLLSLVHPYHPALRSLRRGMQFLTQFAVETRYPGENATRRQAEAALRWAGRVRTMARALLGLRPRRVP